MRPHFTEKRSTEKQYKIEKKRQHFYPYRLLFRFICQWKGSHLYSDQPEPEKIVSQKWNDGWNIYFVFLPLPKKDFPVLSGTNWKLFSVRLCFFCRGKSRKPGICKVHVRRHCKNMFHRQQWILSSGESKKSQFPHCHKIRLSFRNPHQSDYIIPCHQMWKFLSPQWKRKQIFYPDSRYRTEWNSYSPCLCLSLWNWWQRQNNRFWRDRR